MLVEKQKRQISRAIGTEYQQGSVPMARVKRRYNFYQHLAPNGAVKNEFYVVDFVYQ